jgi:uncharacterized protein YutE (UPF0331/DUF86 family)
MEAVTDLVMLVIKDKKLIVPEDNSKSFGILAEAKIINEELAEKLQKARGMRNVLVHQYRDVNDEIIFNATSSQQGDVKSFLEKVERA